MARLTEVNTLQTLDRGLQILECLARSEMGPTEIARAFAVDRATVHRILRTLMRRGFVERVGDSGRYRADLRHLLALTGEMATRRDLNWPAFATPYLDELRGATRLSANLCMPSGKEMVYVMQALAGEGLAVNSPPGTRRPLHSSAVGKAYLGSLPEPELDALLAGLEMQPATPNTILSPATLKARLQEDRARGYYVDDGESDRRVRCVAAPIIDHSGRPVASIGVSGPVDNLPSEDMSAVGELVAGIARRMSAALGHR